MIRITTIFSLWLTVTMLPVHLGAQVAWSYSKVAVDSLVNPPVMKDGKRVLYFDSYSSHIGTISENDAARNCRFTFRNASRSAIRITKVRTSCGCTAAMTDTSAIAPGGKGDITLTFTPRNRPGTVDIRAFVYASVSEKSPVAVLSLSGEVTEADGWGHFPYSSGTLKMKRKQVTFTEVTSAVRPSERIVCVNAGDRPLKPSAKGLPAYASFHTEPEIIQPGEEADIVITIDGAKALERGRKQMHFFFAIEGTDAHAGTGGLMEVSVICNDL